MRAPILGATSQYHRSAAVPAAGSRSVPLRKLRIELDSRGVTPPEPAGADAHATILSGAASLPRKKVQWPRGQYNWQAPPWKCNFKNQVSGPYPPGHFGM